MEKSEQENTSLGIDDTSCCMEIAGIESMIDGVEAPTVRDMLNNQHYHLSNDGLAH